MNKKESIIFPIINYLILVLSLLVSSRYFQQIILDFKKPVNISILGSKLNNDSCFPASNSLINYIQSNDLGVLFIILDGYPTKSYYKYVTNQESVLHKYLQRESSEVYEGETIINSSSYSLAYLLGRVQPDDDYCLYPNFKGSLNHNFLLASKYYSSNESLCKDFLPPFDQKRNKTLRKNYKKMINILPKNIMNINNKVHIKRSKKTLGLQAHQNFPEKCYLTTNSFTNEIQNYLPKNKKISFIHDVDWHDYAQTQRPFSSTSKNKLIKFDESYLKAIKNLIKVIKEGDYSIDHLVIMSDHGPRLKSKDKEFGEGQARDYPMGNSDPGSISAKNNFGYFFARIDISNQKSNINMVNTIPDSTDRWDLLEGRPYKLCRWRCDWYIPRLSIRNNFFK